MTVQTTLNEYQAGKLDALEILEQFIQREMDRGRKYWSSEQIYSAIRSIRLTCQKKWRGEKRLDLDLEESSIGVITLFNISNLED